MAAIKSKNTQPELYVRKVLHAAGFRFRLNRKDLPGTPDIVLPRYKTAVFVHGCFWHGHTCKKAHTPRSNTAYWSAKIERNKNRDARSEAGLREAGWRTVTLWECSLQQGAAELIEELNTVRSRARKPQLG
jgi:DNA mismatch endonuclease (patch repair protein)